MCSPFVWNGVQYTIVIATFQRYMRLRLPTASDIKNKTVLVRVDYNVPLKLVEGKYQVIDDRRIQASLETIKFLQKHQAKVVLVTHLGRPKGEKKKKLSLKPIAQHLTQKLQMPTLFAEDCIGEKVEKKIKNLNPGQVLLLENVRFYKEEKKNDEQFTKQLAQLADVYINEAFSAAHRAHASTVGITKYLPSFAGFQLAHEVKTLHQLMTSPPHPFVIVVGGAKISDKIGALENLLHVADLVLVGGGVANNFLKAENLEIHKSYLQDNPVDDDKKGTNFVKLADKLIEETKTEKFLKDGYVPLPKIVYPLDVIAASSPQAKKTEMIDLTHDMEDTSDDKNLMYLDIGPNTIRLYLELIKQAKAIFWNGPMGVFEKEPFKTGTTKIAQAIADSSAQTVVGGGDTVAAINKLKLEKKYTHVSTAGGAGLVFLANQKMPALQALTLSSS